MSDTTFLITGGFFDAVDSDRLYSADQMNQPYKKLIHDGINREADGTAPGFAVTAGSGMNVLVAARNAMIDGKWAESKAVQTIAIAGNTSGSARIDSIILQCDKSRAVRAVQIVYRQGTTTAPDLVSSDDITELRLANIRVPSAASAIASENITDTRGSAECPWVRSVFDAPDARYIVEEYTGTELAGAHQTVKSAVDSIRYAAQSGQPTVALQASDMIDSDKVYLYQGGETGYSAGYLYYYSDAAGAWIRGAQYGASVVDTDLDADSENPVQNKAVAAAITELNERLDSLGDGVPTEVRQALLTLFQSVAYAETGLTDEIAVIASWASVVTAIALNQTSINISGASTSQLVATTTPAGGTVTWASSDTSVATVSNSGLVTGVGNGTATITASCGGKTATCTATVTGFATLTGITATYTQSGTVYDTDSLSNLKSDLVVVASYDNSTTRTLSASEYTLSGTLSAGTSTITVSYNGKTTTFNVTVSSVLYKLTNGTHEFTGTNTGYVTISNHSHVKAQRTNASGSNKNYNFICLSDLEFNGTEMNANTNINNHDTLFSLASDDVVRFVVSNVIGDFDDYTIGFRKASGTTSVAAVASQTTDCDTEVTVSSAENAGCLFLYMGTQNATNKNIEFDIAVYVNDVRYF